MYGNILSVRKTGKYYQCSRSFFGSIFMRNALTQRVFSWKIEVRIMEIWHVTDKTFERRIMIDIKAGDKACKCFVLFSILYLLVTAVLLDTPAEIFAGMKRIVISRDALITDYFVIGGYGAAFFNAALVMLIEYGLLLLEKVNFTGLTLAALYINGGFALFGKNPVDILPIILGTVIYAVFHHARLSRYIYTAIFGTCLAPFVTELVYILPFGNPVNGILAVAVGIFIGFALPPLSAHTASMHMGYNLFNVGFSAGILAFVLMCVLQSFGISAESTLIWQEKTPLWLILWLSAFFMLAILYGLYRNKGNWKAAWKITRHPGRAVADFVLMDGAGATFMNMGAIGIVGVIYILAIGGDLSGPVIGAMLTAFGFAAFGAHSKNYLPVLAGVFLSTFINKFEPTTPAVQLAAMFAVGIAPIAGQFGVIAGILAGGLHVAIVTCTTGLYGGLNLYNNGFSCGLVAIIMVPLAESFIKRFETRRVKRAKNTSEMSQNKK